jgi:hypothetical protein
MDLFHNYLILFNAYAKLKRHVLVDTRAAEKYRYYIYTRNKWCSATSTSNIN